MPQKKKKKRDFQNSMIINSKLSRIACVFYSGRMKPGADGSEWMNLAVKTLFLKNKLPPSAENKSLAVSYTTREKNRQKQAGTWDHKTDHK